MNEIPALFRVPESSFNVALLGSTPRVREKSFVAKSISGFWEIYVEFWVPRRACYVERLCEGRGDLGLTSGRYSCEVYDVKF